MSAASAGGYPSRDPDKNSEERRKEIDRDEIERAERGRKEPGGKKAKKQKVLKQQVEAGERFPKAWAKTGGSSSSNPIPAIGDL